MEFEERYFREELDYLRQLSKLLATEKPHLARFLAEKDADPDIERLLEGVAFLTGNLRQKIEDEFPELTHGLIKMLWPNYLRPVPAMTLIEYTPDMDKSSVPVLIPRNEQFTTNAGEIRVDEVLPSDAKKEEPPPCTFTLCRDIWLLPVRLEQIENRSTTRNGVINITFSVAPGTDFRTLDLNKLRFWLGNDDNYTRDQLYLWFCEYLQGADLTVGEQHLRLPEFMLKAVGFEPQDAMLPWPKNVHSGYRILQEYFCYPDAFLFFDLCGCPALPDGLQAEFFTLQLRFSRPLPVDIRLRRDSLRLYCAPAINLFIHHAEAITLDNRRADYPLVPSRHYPQHYDVFSVNSVVSQVQDMFRKKDLGRPVSTQAARQWPAFESFSHQMEYSRKREVVYWHPGYVGYGEGGVLTEAIRQKPYSVVLLDEVEKAHPDVLNLFYQAFDKGEMADGEGRLIDCKNIVFFLTSNLGYQVIVEHADDPETIQEVLYPVLADFFKPALLARMEVVPYLPLSKETLATIIAGKLARLDNVLRSRFGAEVVIEPEVTDEIMSRVTRAENGARMLESVIDGDMLPPLSLLLLQKMAANTAIARIRLSAVDGAFTADVEDAQNDESVTKDETVL
ncbi:type VI secretion system baseplate subunit TssF [Escherichia coli]|nr:type VI secretion system baseplate subunit TssF [Escherichia coli]EFA3722849.1 type VI secretion system baseplate subunit TssF [Escherichia coli]EIY3404337.1 type VI secretion system baseplate subunit TssF [Escherichia coli]EMD4941270.1 type VI secretion system baseplate subunit TssF [Escherichia coli]HBN3722026.1 type VI secretion system baseplate subunit TssF [Escherichia coli]